MKSRVLKMAVGAAVLALLAACGGEKTSIPPEVHEKLIWSSSAERPEWTMQEPETNDGIMYFVGLSEKYATEKGAREDARNNAASGVVKYMGTLVKDKFERARVSYGLESDVVNPTASARSFEKQLSVNMAKKVKVKNWYEEKWHTPTGVGWKVFVLMSVPQGAIDETYKETAANMARKAEQDAKEANDELAKRQAEKAAEFWKQMQDQGVME